tara:strand:- start:2211 stop:2681 length:471 start_codon:yes stop_codon:yes gene_type:complete
MSKIVDTLVLDNEEDFQKMLYKLAEEILDERPIDWYSSYVDSGPVNTSGNQDKVNVKIVGKAVPDRVMDNALKCAKDSRDCKGSVENPTFSVKSHAFQVLFNLIEFVEQEDLDLWVAEVLESVETVEELWKLKDRLAEHIRDRARAAPLGDIDKAW